MEGTITRGSSTGTKPAGQKHRQPHRADAGEIIAMPCWAIIASWHYMSIYGTDENRSPGQVSGIHLTGRYRYARKFPADSMHTFFVSATVYIYIYVVG
jgi:hypothetical protein